MDNEKTKDKLISGINCSPESAFEEFTYVKERFGKTDGRQYYHIIQSFSPDDDVTPEMAHEIALKFAECFPGISNPNRNAHKQRAYTYALCYELG